MAADFSREVGAAINHCQGSDQDLFGDKPEKQRYGFCPLNAQRLKYRSEKQPDTAGQVPLSGYG